MEYVTHLNGMLVMAIIMGYIRRLKRSNKYCIVNWFLIGICPSRFRLSRRVCTLFSKNKVSLHCWSHRWRLARQTTITHSSTLCCHKQHSHSIEYVKEMTLFARHHKANTCRTALYAFGVGLSVAIVKEHKPFSSYFILCTESFPNNPHSRCSVQSINRKRKFPIFKYVNKVLCVYGNIGFRFVWTVMNLTKNHHLFPFQWRNSSTIQVKHLFGRTLIPLNRVEENCFSGGVCSVAAPSNSVIDTFSGPFRSIHGHGSPIEIRAPYHEHETFRNIIAIQQHNI